MQPVRPSVRIRPDDWLGPMPLASYFPTKRPIEVDLGCGKGRFLLAHAKKNPDVNFLGIDRMLKRIRKIDNRVKRRGDDNVRLFRMEGYYATTFLIPPAAIRAYYIFHPDPWPKNKHAEHRMFNPRFVDALHRTLEPGGVVHIQTDHIPYYEAILEIFRRDPRFSEIAPLHLPADEQTDFELWYLDKGPIGRCSFQKV